MSQYGIIYRMEFKNVEGNTVRVNISPTDILIDDSASPVIYTLVGSGNPLVISTANNEEDKFFPIRSKAAHIEFRTDSYAGLDVSAFSQGGDNLWKVNIYLQDTPQLIFTGFLIMADNQQPFQPDPVYVTLTATDHLAALKEIKLTDDSLLNPLGKYRMATLIALCLKKTGLSLPINVVNNLRPGSGTFQQSATFTTVGFTTALTNFFYPGQQIVISLTTTNNGTFDVLTVTNGTLTTVVLKQATTAEVDINATFVDAVSGYHIYDVSYIDAKTFETRINECENCYSVLSKIFGEDCFITQWKGEWWVMRVDEFEGNPIYVAAFDKDGIFLSIGSGTAINKSIGRNPVLQDHQFAKADELLRFVRPHGFVRETFRFNSPLEIPCNSDFSRGALSATVNAYQKQYVLDCWTVRRGLPGAYNVPITIFDYITRTFDPNNQEKDRYITITPQTGHVGFSSTDDEYIESEAIAINAQDKFSGSIQWRIGANIASSSASPRLFRFILIGDDGSAWILGKDSNGNPKWFNTSVWTVNTGEGATGIVFGDQNETEWQTISWTAAPAPVSGNLYIWIAQFYQASVSGMNTNIDYTNLQFEYIPFINGSYQKYTGYKNQIDRTGTGYFANRDNEIFIADSPAKIFKGAIFMNFAGSYRLSVNWFASAPFALGYPPSPAYVHPYAYIQAYSVWNQYKGYNNSLNRGIGINIFDGSVKGLTASWPDMLHKYSLTDINPQTNDRYFMLISFEQNWKTCLWRGVFIEVYNTAIGKSYTDPETFKYLTD